VDVEDPAPGLVVRKRKLDLPVYAARPDEGRVQAVDPVGGHDDLHVATRVEPVQLRKGKIIVVDYINGFDLKFHKIAFIKLGKRS
jgi:hypothetical protein